MDATATKGARIRKFFESEADVLYNRFRVIETLLPKPLGRGSVHPGEEGRFVESLLRGFLNRHLPADLRAISGFILRTATKTGGDDLSRVENEIDRNSRQLDIIIYDMANFPIYERFEEFCVVPPEGVVGIISVKKTLRLAEVKGELEGLREAIELCSIRGYRPPVACLFSFTSDNCGAAAVYTALAETLANGRFDSMPTEIIVFDEYVVFKFRKESSPDNTARYVEIDCKKSKHIAVQRLIQSLLGVYYDPTRGSTRSRPGFVSFEKGTFRDAHVLGNVPIQTEADGLEN